MKKYLYGTTALAAVALAAGPALAEAEPLHMELGGYFTNWFLYADPDHSANQADNARKRANVDGANRDTPGESTSIQNAEVYFKMRGELDNGLRIGGRIELEGESTGDQIDQAYLVLAGGFGEFRLVNFSILLVLIMIYRPQGILGSWTFGKGGRKAPVEG